MGKIVVVGGGIVGATAAYWLTRSGHDVQMIDVAHEGYATAAGAGIVSPGTSVRPSPEWYPLAFAAVHFYPTLVSALRDDGVADSGYDTPGTIFLATNDRERERLGEVLRLIEARKSLGAPNIGNAEFLDEGDAQQLFHALGPDQVGIYVSGGGRVNGRRMREALRRAFVKRGGVIDDGAARLVRGSHDGVWSVLVGNRQCAADAIVLAAGAWGADDHGQAGVVDGVYPQRGQILHVDYPATGVGEWPSIVCFGSHYMVTFPERRVVVGATREDHAGFDYRVTVEGQAELLKEAVRIAPGLGPTTVAETRVGFRPMTGDGFPILGNYRGSANIIVANGLGASGLTMGPFIGQLAAGIVNGEEPAVDMKRLDPNRFAPASVDN